MLTPTHLVGGQTAYLLVSLMQGQSVTLTGAITAVLSALIPDLDSHRSYVGRLLPWISKPLEYQVGHRTLTHSLLLVLSVCAVLSLWLPASVISAIASGWFSHIVLDMMTPAGVCAFWPWRQRCVLPGNQRYRMSSMGPAELWLLVILAVIGTLSAPLTQQGRGTLGLIRDGIGDVSAARQEFDQTSPQQRIRLQVDGYDQKSLQSVNGLYEIIAAYQANGFLLLTEQGVQSACQSADCEWYLRSVELRPAEERQITVYPIKHRQLELGDLLKALKPYAANAVYLTGNLQAGNLQTKQPTLRVNDRHIQLNHLQAQDLQSWPDQRLSEVDITVRIDHPTGETLPNWQLQASQIEPEYPPQLRRWLP